MGLKVCNRCLMDSSDPEIKFDDKGFCNHCVKHFFELPNRVWFGEESKNQLEALIQNIKERKNKTYDCLIGLSGGTDSSYLAFLVKKFDLKPLAVHLDNGWNSELAVKNIETLVKKLDIDLYTHVIDWEEFKDIQLSFIKSSTPDGEIPSDHAINALMFKIARKYNIKYILSGMNYMTESIMPRTWAYGHLDWNYINSVHRKFGLKKIKTYPRLSIFELGYIILFKRIKYVSLLNYIQYDKEKAIKTLEKIGWKPYANKHGESIYTRFYQSYYLPKKFGIDKRKAHLSNLILANQINREEGLSILKKPIRPKNEINSDLDYVLKKFSLSNSDFQKLIKLPNKSFKDYNNNESKIKILKRLFNFLRSLSLFSK